MTWYKSATNNTYMIYLSPNGIGIYLEFSQSIGKITQLFVTSKLFSIEKVENSEGYFKPNEAVINKIWKQIVEHPSWDKMLIEQIFKSK